MSLIRKLKSKNNKINIHQSFDGELGSTVWDCALVLLKYLENKDDFPTDFFKGKRVIELGAGTGVIGIALAFMGAEVILTDRKPLLELMNKNIEENCVTKSCKAIEYNCIGFTHLENKLHIFLIRLFLSSFAVALF
eukprot:TRINITY_DN4240_c0_g1_i3.p1 TRINITY_DN4240_c0_g1~~TRINITY_DN4240_c0_g1_i3.p1  ORF type:complete len:136 (-),score=19.28 TRINITY_DN4240_c0_g1_i3:21-428(-)